MTNKRRGRMKQLKLTILDKLNPECGSKTEDAENQR
jgi:hypothetical protein